MCVDSPGIVGEEGAPGGLCAPPGMKWVETVHDRRLKDGRVIKVHGVKLVREDHDDES